jgi:hypothetical protein
MMVAAAVGHRSGRATPSLRDAPQRQSMEIVGREMAVTMNIGPLVLTNFGPPSGV